MMAQHTSSRSSASTLAQLHAAHAELAPQSPAKQVRVIDPRAELGLWEQLYIPQILRGLAVTTAIFLRNMGLWLRGKKGGVTIQYPEERLTHAPRYRGLHILAQREDGSPRCVACFMCSTACPADCIYIEAEEHPDPKIEKRPKRFQIDLSRCIFCGFCEEACPCEAIYLTPTYDDMPKDNFSDLIIDLDFMLNRDQNLVTIKKTAIKGRR